MKLAVRPRFWELLKKTAEAWNAHSAPRLGAALAYYTLLSVAPLLVLIVAICALVLGQGQAEHQLIAQLRSMVGPSTAKTLASVLDNTRHASTGIFASVIALVTLLFGASGVFIELRDSLNTIWDAPPDTPKSAWKAMLFQRLVSFGMVLALGLLLLASLLLSTAMAVFTRFFDSYLPLRVAILGETANFVVPLLANFGLFALLFKFVPNVPIRWREVAVGAAVTAICFQIGKSLLALYLATAGVGSTYGAAGSLVAFVVWVYYSAQIFFFGAVFTKVYADSTRKVSASQAPQAQLKTTDLSQFSRGASA